MTALPDRLLVVTDRHQARRPLQQTVREIAAAGARWLWFRDRDLAEADRRRLAHRLSAAAGDFGMALSIGDDVGLAEETGAAGVHLRRWKDAGPARARLGDGAVIGVSAHSLDEVWQSTLAGADYVTLSPIFETASKPGHGPALGLEELRAASQTGLPVLALGGITTGLIADCTAAAAAGVAVMGEIMRSPRPASVVEQMLAALARN